MRTEHYTITVYTFTELSDEAQDKAIDHLWDINIEHDWWDHIYEDAKNIGLKITEFDLDRHLHVDMKMLDGWNARHIAFAILNNHGATCDTFSTARGFLVDRHKARAHKAHNGQEALALRIWKEEIQENFIYQLQNDYASMLQAESEYRSSREAILETIEANEYEFTEDGKLH